MPWLQTHGVLAMNYTFFNLPSGAKNASWLCLGFAMFLTWDLWHWWSLKQEYSFGFLVPFFVAFVVYERWPKIKSVLLGSNETPIGETPAESQAKLEEAGMEGEFVNWALALVFAAMAIGGLFCLLLGAVYRTVEGPQLPASLLMVFGFGNLVLSLVYFNCDSDANGRRIHTRQRLALTGLFLFPAMIWLLSAPLLDAVESKISLFLLNKVVIVVFSVFDLLGFPLEREGNIIVLPKGRVGVADACSGIRSLTACLFAGSFLAAVFLKKFWKKVLLVGLAMALAFFTNILRSIFLTGWAYRYGSDALSGKVHDVTGYAILLLTCLGLVCLLPIFDLKIHWARSGIEEPG